MDQPFTFRSFLKSFRFAGRGICWIWKSEPNFRIHCLIGTFAVILGFVLQLSSAQWTTVILAIGLVLAAEAFNSAIEFFCDAVHPNPHPLVGMSKDAAAAAVLFVALAASAAGAIVFLPEIWEVIGKATQTGSMN